MEEKNRDEIPEQYHWDLASIFATDEAFLSALEEAKAYPGKCAAYQDKISQSAQELLAYLRLDDEINVAMGRIFNYAQRKCDEDTRVSKYQDFVSQAMSVYVAISSASAWFTPELLSLSEAQMAAFYAECPELELYRRNLDRVFRRRAHTLSPAEEALLASAGDMASQPDNIYSMFGDADLTFPDAVDAEGEKHPLTHGTFVPLLYSQDRVLRKSAFDAFYSVMRQFRNTCAAILNAQTKQLKFFADARKYPSTLAAALDTTEVPTEVYMNLVDAVRRNLPKMHKYTRLRRKLLGVDELHFYDLYVPIVGDVDMHFT